VKNASSQGDGKMRKKDGLSRAAEKVGAVVGRAEGTARKIKKAGVVAKKELDHITKQIENLKRQLQKTTKRLKHALR
jgi:polyhydroxyalkanoate synthesis regulator phasin